MRRLTGAGGGIKILIQGARARVNDVDSFRGLFISRIAERMEYNIIVVAREAREIRARARVQGVFFFYLSAHYLHSELFPVKN